MTETEQLNQEWRFRSEIKVGAPQRSIGYFRILHIQYYVLLLVVWFFFFGILNSAFGMQFGPAIFSAFVAVALALWIQRRAARLKIGTVVDAYDVVVDEIGIKFSRGRSVTHFGWEDVKTIEASPQKIKIVFVGGDGDFKIEKSAFADDAKMIEFKNFLRDRVSTTTAGNA